MLLFLIVIWKLFVLDPYLLLASDFLVLRLKDYGRTSGRHLQPLAQGTRYAQFTADMTAALPRAMTAVVIAARSAS